MLICQTLWSAKKNLLEENFGWYTPQHHLMGWALSALKLSQHYDTVRLYTDNAGKEMLVDRMGIPYTDVFTDYDNLNCPPELWAFPKLLTYERQDRPFLHVDGDVMVWKPFSNDFLTEELLAQNLERGTQHYKGLFEPIINELAYMPPCLERNLNFDDMRAYNAGIIGGSDVSFFKKYVSLAKRFIEANSNRKVNIAFNAMFEQLLFFSMAENEKKKVACLFDQIIDDNGYSNEVFANFTKVEKLGYLHLIGPFKRSKEVCDWMARYLRRENEEMFLKIIDLFKQNYYFSANTTRIINNKAERNEIIGFRYHRSEKLARSIDPTFVSGSNRQLDKHIARSQNTFLKELFKYEKRIHRIYNKFKKMTISFLEKTDDDMMYSMRFLSYENDKRWNVRLFRNPYAEIIHTAYDWPGMKISPDSTVSIRCSDNKDIIVGIAPDLFFPGYREVALDETCVNIMVLTEGPLSYNDLISKVRDLFPPFKNEKEHEGLCELTFLKVGFLIQNKLIFIHEGDNENT